MAAPPWGGNGDGRGKGGVGHALGRAREEPGGKPMAWLRIIMYDRIRYLR